MSHSYFFFRLLGGILVLSLAQGGCLSDALSNVEITRVHTKNPTVLYDSSLPNQGGDDALRDEYRDDTRKLVEDQQRQIAQLTELITKNFPSNDTNESTKVQSSALSPLKVMLFIDGTWLYYSLHGRDADRDPIQASFGPGWQKKYNVDWANLPRVIGHALQEQDAKSGWMPISATGEPQSRPVEVVRVSVYTSFRGDTPKTSLRYQMFQDMIDAKYDVLMLQTIGLNEKCVDIQLAVDMLHYATVPDAYDVALLLTGDKDFIPAMVRSRQKGRRVGLVSMRSHSSKSLFETPNIKDYDIIWLEDHLTSIIKPRNAATHLQGNRPKPNVSEFLLLTVVSDFVRCSEFPSISCRDIGRYVKTLVVGKRNVLAEIKEIYGGLYQFLVLGQIFTIDQKVKKEYWVGLHTDAAMEKLAEAKKQATLSQSEVDFLNSYSPESLLTRRPELYPMTLMEMARKERKEKQSMTSATTTCPWVPVDYSSKTCAELSQLCREKGLKVSGRKAELIQRLEESSDDDMIEQTSSFQYLEDLMMEYLHASGGKQGSRDLGRYFTANKPSPAARSNPSTRTALQELKYEYGTLTQFVGLSSKVTTEGPYGGSKEFVIQMLSK